MQEEPAMLTDHQDAFGHNMLDHLNGRGGHEIVERDDGYFNVSLGPTIYFAEYDEWSEIDQAAIDFVRGRVLDVGCGAGRHALYLQARGFDVLGVDVSPRAIEVCRARGLINARLLSITQISRRLGIFDTILMLGNNFSLVANPKRARWLLKRFRSATSESGRIIAQTRDPYKTDVVEHLAYHERNRQNGKMAGEARIRVRYKKYVTPWLDFLMVSQDEMKTMIEGTGWAIATVFDGANGVYTALLEKTLSPETIVQRSQYET
jgi:SAM-dependent methyltransferase